MSTQRKDVALNLRLRPEMKKALELASQRECRTQTGLIEWLLKDYCASNGISISELVATQKKEMP